MGGRMRPACHRTPRMDAEVPPACGRIPASLTGFQPATRTVACAEYPCRFSLICTCAELSCAFLRKAYYLFRRVALKPPAQRGDAHDHHRPQLLRHRIPPRPRNRADCAAHKAARDAWVAGDAGSPNARRAAVTRQEAEGVIGGRFNLEQLGVGDLTPCAG